MKISSNLNTIFGSIAFLGVIILLTLAFGLCGFFGAQDIECGTITLLGNSMPSRDFLLGGIIFLIITGLLFKTLIKRLELQKPIQIQIPLSLSIIWHSSFLSKLYDLILLALRQGILHPKIYNLIPITY